MVEAHLVGYETIVNKTDQGGFNLPDIDSKIKSLRLKYLGRFLEQSCTAIWKDFFKCFVYKWENLKLFMPCLYMTGNKSLISSLPVFYQEMFLSWYEFSKCANICILNANEILYQPLFMNDHITHNGKMIYSDYFVKSGIFCISDILYVVIPGLLPLNAIMEMITDTFPDVNVTMVERIYTALKAAIPSEWLKRLKSHTFKGSSEFWEIYIKKNKNAYSVCSFSTKDYYQYLISTFC